MEKTFIADLDKIKDVVQDSNLNFLIGSGCSVPFFKTLGNIEVWLTELDLITGYSDEYLSFVKASIYYNYFQVAMQTNPLIRHYSLTNTEYLTDDKNPNFILHNTLLNYINFLSALNNIVYERRSNMVNKQVNVFTTNIDIFIEKAIESLGLQFNDGFHGVFRKTFSLSNYKKSYFQKSLHYDNISELPVFNLLKVHGSITWEKTDGAIVFNDLNLIEDIEKSAKGVAFLDISLLNSECRKSKKRDVSIKEICDAVPGGKPVPDVKAFIEQYEKLQIVNPTKGKFKDTTFNKNYYEMLRLYSNELEKEATSLFVMGFSLADEHIREITIRAIKSNPTLFVFICTFLPNAEDIIANLKMDGFEVEKHRNVRFIHLDKDFDLKKINELLFQSIIKKIKDEDK